jgi:hypothetical protein
MLIKDSFREIVNNSSLPAIKGTSITSRKIDLPELPSSRSQLGGISSKVNKKLFGNLSVRELAFSRKENEVFGMKGYDLPDSELRFNFGNKMHQMPKALKKSYLDDIQKKGAKLPSSVQYTCNQHKGFDVADKQMKIYAAERVTYCGEIAKDSKKSPGIGKYNITDFDERRVKPPKGLHKLTAERVMI